MSASGMPRLNHARVMLLRHDFIQTKSFSTGVRKPISTVQQRRLASQEAFEVCLLGMSCPIVSAPRRRDRMTKLTNKIALVTGASRGMGRATARALAAEGAHVIVHYGSAKAEADSLLAEIRNSGGKANAIQADLGSLEAVADLVAKTKAIVGDRLDILVANAGISGAAAIADQKPADFDRLYAVNVRAPYFIVQGLLPLFGEGSSVILLSSLAVQAAVGELSAYAASKGAVDTLVKHFAAALGPKGIRVNAVAPGVIETDMSAFAKTEQGRTFILGMQALKRIGQPEDVAPVVAFLASDDARWITGTTIAVDGGSKL
jgi:3-oxoacyl-[acyl-carrier protein] reductase